ncbi:hypothetical protein [Leptonema illini]|uniref:Lipocalin-like domain-containing protein n=1 Tax=Leptonema illini DSM 21528 TaxID=929563 RepID=H2CLB8_9LEPT|nr:hypothetical protein [Leptonema illini]EHQ04715.1 hypothetical protein Lepil_4051 [Leptonema illini DSM 21528]
MKRFLLWAGILFLLSCVSRPDAALCPDPSEKSRIVGFWEMEKSVGDWNQYEWVADLLLITNQRGGCFFYCFGYTSRGEPVITGKWSVRGNEVLFETDRREVTTVFFDNDSHDLLLFRQHEGDGSLLIYKKVDCDKTCKDYQ